MGWTPRSAVEGTGCVSGYAATDLRRREDGHGLGGDVENFLVACRTLHGQEEKVSD